MSTSVLAGVGAALMFAGTAMAAPGPEPREPGPLLRLIQEEFANPLAGDKAPRNLKEGGDLGDKAKALTSGFGDLLTSKQEISQKEVEIRVNAYAWLSKVDVMKSEASSDDIRNGQGNGYVPMAVTTIRDFDKDFGLPLDPQLIINPEITARFVNTVIRLSWWQWTEDGGKVLTENIAYGDLTYQQGLPIKGDLTLMDAKFIYEYRWLANASARIQLFSGLSIHYLEYTSNFTYQRAWGWAEGGCPIGQGSPSGLPCPDPAPGPAGITPNKGPEKKKEPGDYGILTISFRGEWEPVEGFALSLDTQSMYMPWFAIGKTHIRYGYTDTKAGLWVNYTRYARIGVGYRIWSIYADVRNAGKDDTNFLGKAGLSGLWGSLMFIFP